LYCEKDRRGDAETLYMSLLQPEFTIGPRVRGLAQRSIAVLYLNEKRFSEALQLFVAAQNHLESWYGHGTLIEGIIRCRIGLGQVDDALHILGTELSQQPPLDVRLPLYLLGAEISKSRSERSEAIRYLEEIGNLAAEFTGAMDEEVLDRAAIIAWNYDEVDIALSLARHVGRVGQYRCDAVPVYLQSLYMKGLFDDCILASNVIMSEHGANDLRDLAIKMKVFSQGASKSDPLRGMSRVDVARVAETDSDFKAYLDERGIRIDALEN
jgi:hypothetical protein